MLSYSAEPIKLKSLATAKLFIHHSQFIIIS